MPDYKRHGARYRARRRAVDILFEAETRDVDPVAIVEDRAQLSLDPANAVAPVADYTRTIVAGAAEKLDDLDDAIERHLSEDWELFRLPAVDRQILRVAAWEILFNDEVDAPVSIAEGVEMAAEYSGVDAAPYINVVLDGVAQHAASNAPFAGEEAEDAYAVDEDADTVGVFDAPEQDASVPSEAEDLGSDTAREIAESTEDLEAGEPAVDESRG
ncbi:transcription antitermination factor NusB [Corynebacterium wankanglinii]|uniref:Transcription antitermination protein NusB n=1 Tax=Corynebacterium wankanglinii TaxID=2735136 RepID=A0A838CMA9_9CORY|nr:transcription antitermination factor NusB [Corynebacterium wankanglinii]MBA1835729.1 transcription antitermination factor NusB [Corynebacterium wankanglinii]